MLVNTFGKKISASGVAKNSQFYIDLAKFVEAYKMIISNPNDFLLLINEKPLENIDEKLSWEMLSKIILNCDFGFNRHLDNDELKALYAYAIQIGSISKKEYSLATTDEIADAQKNYYNFIDESFSRAESEYEKQRKITKIREDDANEVNVKLIKYSIQRWIAFSIMVVAVILFSLSVAGIFISNPFVAILENVFDFEGGRYLSAIVNIILSILLFALFDYWNLKSKRSHFDLNYASQVIFEKFDTNFVAEQVLKHKFEVLSSKLKIAKSELQDENKTFDVIENIKSLVKTNEIYHKFYKGKIIDEQLSNTNDNTVDGLINESANEIALEGRFDEEAYKEKFEKSRIKSKVASKQSNVENEQKNSDDIAEKIDENKKLKEQQILATSKQTQNIEKQQIDEVTKNNELIEANATSDELDSEKEKQSNFDESKEKEQSKQQNDLQKEREEKVDEVREQDISDEEMEQYLDIIESMLGK